MFNAVWRQMAQGKTLMRAMMNHALSAHRLAPGLVIDVGGGNKPSYLGYLQGVKEATVVNVDTQYGSSAGAIDFERDPLPYETGSVDQVLLLNVLEHIYRHQHLASECHRILKEGATLIGFVPFLINYHPDPHDYFRYTEAALERIFTEAGFAEVSIQKIGRGPFAVNFNTLASFLPRAFTVLAWPLYFALDALLLRLRPGLARRFPLGYIFVLTK